MKDKIKNSSPAVCFGIIILSGLIIPSAIPKAWESVHGNRGLGGEATAVANTSAWSMLGNNAQHTSSSSFIGPQTLSNPTSITIAPNTVIVSMVVDGGGVFYAHVRTASLTNAIYGFTADGSIRPGWPVNISDPSNGGVLALGPDGTVYGPFGHKLYAFNPDGTSKWTFDTGGDPGSPIVSPDGTVYIPNYAINSDGTQKWKSVFTTPALGADGTIFGANGPDLSSTGGFSGLNPDGSVKWEGRFGGSPLSPLSTGMPVVGANAVYAVTALTYASPPSYNLLGINPVDGSVMQQLDVSQYKPNTNAFSLAITPNQTVLLNIGSELIGYSPDLSTVRFHDTFLGFDVPVPTIGSDGTIYVPLFNQVGGASSRIVALSQEGALRSDFIIPTAGQAVDTQGIISSNGTVYFPLNCGACGVNPANLFAFTPSRCTLTCSTSEPISGKVGTAISFAASATPTNCSGALIFDWDFGDGSPHSSQQNPTHTYSGAQLFNWSLTASFIGESNCTQSGTINIQPACAASVIRAQPMNQAVFNGQSATLSVTADGTAPFTYQWYVGASGDTSNPIPGAILSSFTTRPLVSVTTYWVRVSNECGSMNSNSATIGIVLSPVIVIPGLAGSALGIVGGLSPVVGFPGDVLNLPTSNPEDLEFTELGVPRAGSISEQLTATGFLHISSILEKDITDLVSFLSSNGYSLNENMFEFPYDWRFSIQTNAANLRLKILSVKQMTGAPRVDIIAHSLGGLVAKQYLTSATDAANVGTLIMLGTPHLGTPKALKALRYGDDLGHPSIVDKCGTKRAAHNMTGLFDLLPGRRYFSLAGGYFVDGADIDGDGVRGLVTDFNSMVTTLKNGVEQVCPLAPNDEEPHDRLSSGLVDAGMVAFHDSLDGWAKPLGVNVFMIAGYNVETISKIVEVNVKLSPSLPPERIVVPIVTAAGDGTSPLVSAQTTSADAIYYADFAKLNTNHSDMVASAPILDQVLGLLAHGGGIYSAQGIATSPPVISAFPRALLFSAFSPVRVSVYDSLGNRTGLKPDGSTESGIPGSSVLRIGDLQHVAVPDSDNYHVFIEGVGEGTFTLWQSELSASGELSRTFAWQSVPVRVGSKNSLTTQFNKPGDLFIDFIGDGNQVKSLPPKLFNGNSAIMFDICLKDDKSGDLFQLSSVTGDYRFTRCRDGLSVSGTGRVQVVRSVVILTDARPDHKVAASFLSGQETGAAVIVVMVAPGVFQTTAIIDTNPSSNCLCGTQRQ